MTTHDRECQRALACYRALPTETRETLDYFIRHAYQPTKGGNVVSKSLFEMATAAAEPYHHVYVGSLAFFGALLAAGYTPAVRLWEGDLTQYHARFYIRQAYWRRGRGARWCNGAEQCLRPEAIPELLRLAQECHGEASLRTGDVCAGLQPWNDIHRWHRWHQTD